MIRWALAPLAIVAVLTVVGGLRSDGPAATAEPVKSCGTYELRPEDRSPHYTDQRCLVDAFRAGRPVTLQLRAFTPDGKLFLHDYRVIGPRLLEIRVRGEGPSLVRCRELEIRRGRPAVQRCSAA